MTPTDKYPPGVVISSTRLTKGNCFIDFVRIKRGARTRFVESVWRNGDIITFRKTDEFPSDGSADRFLNSWVYNKVENEEYKIIKQSY